jgi:hypothetical protein
MKVNVSDQVSLLLARLERIPMDIESGVAEGIMASESTIMSDVVDQYGDIFENVEPSIRSGESIDVIFNVGEMYHFENSTGEQFSVMVESMSSNVLENIKTAVSRNMGVTYGA